MACTDGGVPFPPSREEVLNQKVPSAMLCALMRAGIDATIINAVDWKEAGITEAEFREWWHLHQMRDQQRQAREKRDKLPHGEYAVREEVTFQDRHWFVTAIAVANGTVHVTMVTADNRSPVRKETFKVGK